MKASPFLKWVGGKRQLLPDILPHLPPEPCVYYEPFLGGGAVFFAFAPRRAVLGDMNLRLVCAYRGIRDDVEAVLRRLEAMLPADRPPSRAEYESVRDRQDSLTTDTEAAARFLSIEPLLEDLGPLDLSGIDWVICGGESGTKARPMQPDWARSVRDECADQGVPFHFKQWGGTNKKAAGRELDGRTWDEWPRGFVPPPRRGLPIVATRNAGQGALPLGGDHG